ncbi:MAG TPA: PA14 domain-containing protein, partial [Vicinamibacterales bacterium]|nr:PA14 domain-containing protein [Vicinamibacterales bacterium]
VPIDWSVRFFDASQRPYEPPDIVMLAKQDPIKTQTVDRLDYLSSRGIADGLPNDNVALVAEAVVELPAGELILRTISDDGVRAYVDGKLVIDRWDVHESVVDETPIRAGRRKLRVEYFDRTGWAELRVEIVKHRTLP